MAAFRYAKRFAVRVLPERPVGATGEGDAALGNPAALPSAILGILLRDRCPIGHFQRVASWSRIEKPFHNRNLTRPRPLARIESSKRVSSRNGRIFRGGGPAGALARRANDSGRQIIESSSGLYQDWEAVGREF